MIKSILAVIFFISMFSLISESFSYLGGDTVNSNFEYGNNDLTIKQSQIITFNEFSNEQSAKRYLYLGKVQSLN